MKIFVGNLAKQAKEDELEKLFKEHGLVLSVNIIRDMFSQESKGFGFIEMKDKAEAEKAINALNLTDLHGKKITVNEARPKTENRSGGFRNRGGNSNNRGGGRRY
ncbi:MAG: RRM domain RNA-binding protein [Ignavibacteria bacterium]|nr:MAG: RRM domain RNA-binding protein [Ignavibacteria bacterium]KAF0160370.1 MAG: RRM domain RNA-binding protein [Ignavibacteria bacterium]